MRKFDYNELKNKLWDNDIMGYVSEIHEEKGKQEIYLKQRPEELNKLIEIAKIQSTEASNAIEGIVITSARLKQLCSDKTTPKNRNEEEIAGYRDALNLIHESYAYIPLAPNYILQLHQVMYKHQRSSIGGHFKNVQNYISATNEKGEAYTLFTPVPPYETPEAIQKICDEFNKAIADNIVDPLILIPIFIHDFLCIHPFVDGNGRMSRLLTTLLLYRCGYKVAKYISLEAKISKNKNLYYNALEEAQQGWHENMENKNVFIKYFSGIILSAYRDLKERYDLVSVKATAIEVVRKTISSIVGKFTKAKIHELCPALSIKSIESALNKMQSSGEISRHGTGKATFYTRNNH